MENPIQRAKRIEESISFSERWEEELREKLFEEDKLREENKEIIIDYKTTSHSKRPNEEWDVPITEEIKYFDPTLSYELTGYRPIDMEQGLDFDPDVFREAAIIFNNTGSYTEYPKNCKPYNDFWKEQFKRSQDGYTVGKYRITGDNYFFLNFYRMSKLSNKSDIKSGTGREEGFPNFIAKQYEFFHYVEMAERLHKDVCILKSRGIGLSEIVASLAVRPYTTNKNYSVLLTCAADTKLTPLVNKCWRQLDWLNANTNGGMKHLRLKVNNANTKRASLLTPDLTEYGWMSQINSVVADTSDKIRGDRVDRLIYEESGSNKNLTESWIKGESLVALGGKHFGTRIALGCVCAGTKVWTKDGRHIKIEDIKKEDGILGFHEGSCFKEDIDNINAPAEKECVRITTDYGILECSEDHPIFKRITRSKVINGHRVKWFDYAWFRADEVITTINTPNVIGICDKIDAWGTKSIDNPYLIGSLIKKDNSMPECYMSLIKKDSAELLAGLFDAGIVKNKIYITQLSKEISLQIQELLQKFGIYSNIRDKNHLYNLYIEDTISLVNFYEEIPIKEKYKKERLEKIYIDRKESIIYKHYYKYKGIREAHVIDIEHIGKKTIYNLTANGTHTYLANNFITHNTGGDSMALEGLSNIFANPEAYNVLSYKNYDTDDGKPELTSFFIPAHKFSLIPDYIDNRGVTNYPEFKKFYETQRAKLTDKDFINECAEHCFTPREALSKHGDNVFDTAVLSERMVQIKIKNQYIHPKRIQLLWDKTVGDGMTKVIAKESFSSQLLVVEPPLLDETGLPYKNLYVAGIDAIDMGRKDSVSDRDVSDFCVVVKRRLFGLKEPKYVAMYKYRPDDIRKAYDLTLKLLTWYNCKALLEYTKISIQTYFREKGKSNLFMSRPKFAMSSRQTNKSLVGLPATEAVIRHGLELINNFITDYWYTIDFEEMINQMIDYSYEHKRKFDIIAAMQIECCLSL